MSLGSGDIVTDDFVVFVDWSDAVWLCGSGSKVLHLSAHRLCCEALIFVSSSRSDRSRSKSW